MNFIQSLVYGILSGISAFLPVSAYGHQSLLRRIFGVAAADPLLDAFVHLALLASVLICCRSSLRIFTSGSHRHRGRSHRRQTTQQEGYEIRLVTTAAIAMLLVMVFQWFGKRTESHLLLLCLFFALNGIILYVTDHLRQSNKDARMMAGLDAALMGLCAGLSIFPGISRVGTAMSVAVARGADRQRALSWALMISVPALLLLTIFDLSALFTGAQLAFGFLKLLVYLVSALGAFGAGCATIMLMRFLIVNTGFNGFACYSWGMAILSFILYLIA